MMIFWGGVSGKYGPISISDILRFTDSSANMPAAIHMEDERPLVNAFLRQ